MQHTTLEKLTILADSAKYDVACTSSGASRPGSTGHSGQLLRPRVLPRFYRRRPVRQPAEGAADQPLRL